MGSPEFPQRVAFRIAWEGFTTHRGTDCVCMKFRTGGGSRVRTAHARAQEPPPAKKPPPCACRQLQPSLSMLHSSAEQNPHPPFSIASLNSPRETSWSEMMKYGLRAISNFRIKNGRNREKSGFKKSSNECRRSDGDGEENDINGVIHTVKSQNCFPTPRRNVNLSTISGESRSLFTPTLGGPHGFWPTPPRGLLGTVETCPPGQTEKASPSWSLHDEDRSSGWKELIKSKVEIANNLWLFLNLLNFIEHLLNFIEARLRPEKILSLLEFNMKLWKQQLDTQRTVDSARIQNLTKEVQETEEKYKRIFKAKEEFLDRQIASNVRSTAIFAGTQSSFDQHFLSVQPGFPQSGSGQRKKHQMTEVRLPDFLCSRSVSKYDAETCRTRVSYINKIQFLCRIATRDPPIVERNVAFYFYHWKSEAIGLKRYLYSSYANIGLNMVHNAGRCLALSVQFPCEKIERELEKNDFWRFATPANGRTSIWRTIERVYL
ncbi:unnamed protein product [Nesidiocoris tenuis]|uniref:Uncharacterized protein n=1 Tax=Nesidiocoris tenuis TaxID=355587 RepID=A0A6H5HFJ1_9HEMI|nr:unnamed protein product [Nesidiocoris tenuis]